MLLGTRQITNGDTRRYVVDYKGFLDKGETIASMTVTASAGATSAVGTGANAPALDPYKTSLIFWLTGGTVKEVFTVTVQITTTEAQIVNDTIDFTVVVP